MNVSDPCLSENITLTRNISDVYTSCSTDPIAEEVFGFTLIPSPNMTNVSFIGTGNLTQCVREIEKVFNFSACTPDVNCTVFEVPPVVGTLVVRYYHITSVVKH